MQRRSEDLGSEAAENAKKPRDDELERRKHSRLIERGGLRPKRRAAKAVALDLQRREQRILLGGVVKHAIENGHERDVA